MAAKIIGQEIFEGTQLMVVEHRGEEWFTARDISRALGYKGNKPDAIMKIFQRNLDEFEGVSTQVNLVGVDGRARDHRLFNVQALIKLVGLAKTPKAKALRFLHWSSILLTKGMERLREQFGKLLRVVKLTTRSADGRKRHHSYTIFNAQAPAAADGPRGPDS